MNHNHNSNDIIILRYPLLAEKSSESGRSEKPVAWNYNNRVQKNKNKHTTSTFLDPADGRPRRTTNERRTAERLLMDTQVYAMRGRTRGTQHEVIYNSSVFKIKSHYNIIPTSSSNAEELCRELRGQWNELRIFRRPPLQPTAKMHKLAPFMQHNFTTNTHALASYDLLCEKGHLPSRAKVQLITACDDDDDGPKVSLRVATRRKDIGWVVR